MLAFRWFYRKSIFRLLESAPSRRYSARARMFWHVLGLTGLTIFNLPVLAAEPSKPGREFSWAGDPEGGAPFVEADPAQPDKLVGFDVEIAELIARGLRQPASFINIAFTSIDQSIARGDAEIGLSGIEDTPARRAGMAPTIPYYRFREVLSVRDADAQRFRTLADLKGRRVATLGGTIAYEILLRAERELGIEAISYDDDVHPFGDLVRGRVTRVLDKVIAHAAPSAGGFKSAEA